MPTIERRVSPDDIISYRVRVRLRGARVASATFVRLTDAKRWAQSTESAIREGRYFKTAEGARHTVSDALDRYAREVLPHKPRTAPFQQRQLEWWRKQVGHLLLVDLTAPRIVECRARLLSELGSRRQRRGPSTANRYVAALSHVLSVAVREWDWVDDNPARRVTKLREPRGRARFLSEDTVMWMIVDAYRALGMLAQHPRIDPQRIAIMGWSTGGLVAVYSSMERFWRSYGPPNIQFAAHIGFYGSCAVVYRDEEKVTGKPIRIFHGTEDDLELIEPCRAYVARLKKAGADVALNEYPGVQHAYDWFMFKEPLKLPQARTVRNCSLVEGERGQLVDTKTGKPYDPNVSCSDRGGTLLYNEPAAVATTAAVKEFLRTTFGLKP